nr:hypothetical protein Iba_chr04eCG11360 [Ipomoea batatas]
MQHLGCLSLSLAAEIAIFSDCLNNEYLDYGRTCERKIRGYVKQNPVLQHCSSNGPCLNLS